MRVRGWLLPLWIGALAFGSAFPKTAQADSPKYAHRPLTEALESLRARGLPLIYSSDLVRSDLIVQTEPRADDPRGILEELLAPFGLASQKGPGDTVLIIPASTRPPALGSIAGRVLTRRERRPISDARIVVLGTQGRALSGEDGGFSIPDVLPGSHVLEVSAPGLSVQRFARVRVRAGSVTELFLDLLVAPTLREKIQVDSGPTPPGGEQTEPRTTLKQESIERRTRLGDDLNRALAGSPGIVTGDKSAALSIRGGEPSEALVILDGLEIDEPLHLRDFLGFSSIIDSRTIARADILGGGFPAQYGDHLSGILDLSSVDPTQDGRTLLSTSLIGSSVLTDGAFGARNGKWLLSARTWYPDAVLDIVDPGGEDISPVYHDVLGKAEVPLGGGTVLTGHVLAARDAVDFVNDFGDVDVTARNLSDYVWLDLASPWTPRLYSRTLLSRGSVERERSGSVSVGDTGLAQVGDDRAFISHGIVQDWILRGPGGHTMKWGLLAKRVEAEYEYSSHTEGITPLLGGAPSTTDRLASIRPTGENYGAYFSDRIPLSSMLVLEAGARWDRQSITAEQQISPRLNLIFTPGSRTSFRAAWGRFFQSQSLHDLQVEDGELGIFPAQRSEHRLVAFDHAISGGLTLSACAYSKVTSNPRPHYENLFNPIQIFPEIEPDRVLVAPERSVSRGLELSLSADRGRAFAWSAGYALASARDEIDGRLVPRSWDQRHTFNFSMSYRKGDAWSFDFAGVYHSGWPTTPMAAETVVAPDGTSTIQPILGARNSARYPAYHRLDMKAGRHIPLGRGTLTLFLEVTNLYRQDNVCCVQSFEFLPRSDGSVDVDQKEGFWLKQLPVFGLTWEFGP